MKNIKTYNLFNESLKDKLKGKSEDDIIKSLDGLSDLDKMKTATKYKLSYDLLPDNLIVDGTLYFKSDEITKLPDNLTVRGDLYCSYNYLISYQKN